MTDEFYEDGIKVKVGEVYSFPVGVSYNGVVVVDGREVYITTSHRTREECLSCLSGFIDGEMSRHEREIRRLRFLKEKIDGQQ